jgi:hypothetical protein
MILITGATGDVGASSSAGWRHSATTWSQWSGTSKPQAPAIWNRPTRCGLQLRCVSDCRNQIAEVSARALPLENDFTARVQQCK